MSVDVEIYLSQLVKFFKDNPKDLLNLIPVDKKEAFFERCREVCFKNLEKGEDLQLTRQQMIDICVELNRKISKVQDKFDNYVVVGMFEKGPFGLISLN